MNKYSVWYMPYSKKYLITHPWLWFKCTWRNIRDAWRRSVYGWTYGDVWDWDHWFARVVPDMLRYMADHGSAYPGHPPFETPEKWHDWLHEMAHLIETADEAWQDEHNEYYKEYMEHIMDNWEPIVTDENGVCHHQTTKEPPEIHKQYMKRSQELAKEGEDNVRRALTLIGEHFHNLWD